MATRQISDKMASGELTSIKVGGTAAENEVITGLDMAALNAAFVIDEGSVPKTVTTNHEFIVEEKVFIKSNSPNLDLIMGATALGAAINIFNDAGHLVGSLTYDNTNHVLLYSLSNPASGGSQCQFALEDTGAVAVPFCEVTDVTDDKHLATKEYADTKLASTVAQFTPQSDPGIGEGQVFYDQDKHALSVISDVDMILNIGQEVVARVINNTGSTIPNGVPLAASGVAGGLPTVVLAKADSFTTSTVLGVSTHTIADGNEGFITTFGTLGGDFSTFAIGDKLYLSDTVAGEYTTVAPDIATKIGSVLNNSSSGTLGVSIDSNIALPTVIGALNSGSAGATIDGAYAPITGYSPVYNVGVPVDGPLGRITVPTVGLYRLNINFNISFDDTGNNTAVVDLQLWNVTLGAEALVISSSIAKNSEGCALSPTFVYDFTTANEVFELQVRSTGTTLTTVAYQLVTFDLESVHLRA